MYEKYPNLSDISIYRQKIIILVAKLFNGSPVLSDIINNIQTADDEIIFKFANKRYLGD